MIIRSLRVMETYSGEIASLFTCWSNPVSAVLGIHREWTHARLSGPCDSSRADSTPGLPEPNLSVVRASDENYGHSERCGKKTRKEILWTRVSDLSFSQHLRCWSLTLQSLQLCFEHASRLFLRNLDTRRVILLHVG
jgi:hypothetical protein